jgi:hypothetical protein
MLNRNLVINFLSAAGLGVAIWALSFPITKAAEPWDADSSYYVVSLFVAGVVLGLLFPRYFVATFLGIVVGQLGYLMVFLPSGPLLMLGSLFLLGYSLISVFGVVLGSYFRQLQHGTRAKGENGT